MTIINNIVQHLYEGYGISKYDISQVTEIPYKNIQNRSFNESQEDRFCRFYYDIELLHSILGNDDRSQTAGWFFSHFSQEIPYSPSEFYLQEGKKSLINIIISQNAVQYIKDNYPQYVQGQLTSTPSIAEDRNISINVKYKKFPA